MRTVDRIFGWLMVLAALTQCYGAFQTIHWDRNVILLSIGTGLGQLLLAALNLVRAERRHDLVLARLCVAGNALWITLLVAYIAINHSSAPVILGELLITSVLLGLSVRSRTRSRPM